MRIHLKWELTRLHLLLGSERCGFKSWLLSASYLNISEYWRDEFPELRFPSTGKLNLMITYCGCFFYKALSLLILLFIESKEEGFSQNGNYLWVGRNLYFRCPLIAVLWQVYSYTESVYHVLYRLSFFGFGVLALQLTGCCLEWEKLFLWGKWGDSSLWKPEFPFGCDKERWIPVSKVPDTKSDLETPSYRSNWKILLLIR